MEKQYRKTIISEQRLNFNLRLNYYYWKTGLKVTKLKHAKLIIVIKLINNLIQYNRIKVWTTYGNNDDNEREMFFPLFSKLELFRRIWYLLTFARSDRSWNSLLAWQTATCYYNKSQSFPNTALEFSTNTAHSRTQLAGLLHFPTAVPRYRPGKSFGISGSKSRSRRRALPFATISSITSLFSSPPLFSRSFLFFNSLSRWFMLLVWLWRTLGIRAREWNCSRSEKCFWWRVRCSPMKEVTKCHIERRERCSFHPLHVA